MSDQQPELWIITRGRYDDTQQLAVVAGTREQVQARINELERERLFPEPQFAGWEPPSDDFMPWGFEPLPPFLGQLADLNPALLTAKLAEIGA